MVKEPPEKYLLARLATTSSLSLPADSYIYEIVRVNGNLAAISSDDSLRFIDLQTLREAAGGVLNNVHDGVTCLQVVGDDPNGLLTAGRDAVVQRHDLRSGQKTMQLGDGQQNAVETARADCGNLTNLSDRNAPYLCLASHGPNVAAGTELSHSQAAVLLWDMRSPSRPLQKYIESHNDDVTVVRFHPTLPQCLLSGSTDGLVNIYDVSIPDEDDALVQVHNHGSSINAAGFLANAHLFALSHDESFAVYHLDDEPGNDAADGPSLTAFGDLRPILDCEYVVDVMPSGGGVEATVGAGSHSKQHLDLIPFRLSNEWSFDHSQIVRLAGAHGEEIVRSIHVSNEDGAIFTAGEDGFVKAWRTSAGEKEEREQTEAERPRKKKKKSAADGGNESGRYKPY